MGSGGKQLGLARSSIRAAIDTLERRIGVRLIRRTKKGIELTEEGRRVVEEARQMLGTCDHHLETINAIGSQETRQIVVGSIFGFHSSLVESIDSHELIPGVMTIDDPAEPILDGSVDAALLLGPTAKDDLLQRHRVGAEKRVAVLRRDLLPDRVPPQVDLSFLDTLEWPLLPDGVDGEYLKPWLCVDIRGRLPPHQSRVTRDIFKTRTWLLEGPRVMVTTATIARVFSVENVLAAIPVAADPWVLDLVARRDSDLHLLELAEAFREACGKSSFPT